MSLVTALRDYVDVLTATTLSLGGNITLQELITQTFIYGFQTLWLAFIYIITGQWIRDLAFLPIKAPQISLSVIKEGYVAALSPFSNILSFSENFQREWNPFQFFFIGFLNSFFASLPISSAHLLSGRRLLVQGIPAGLASGFGTLTGQFFFLTCVLFGIRPLVIPWVSFQPWSAFLSFGILISIVYGAAHKRSFQTIQNSDLITLGRFFSLNFILSWCEQSAFFHHLGNITVFPSGSALESFSLSTGLSSFFVHSNYLLGFFLGSCLFGIGFLIFTLFCKDLVLKWTNLSLSGFLQGINFCLMSSIIALCLCTFPFYGLDLLFGKPFGILPEERSLRGTVISPNKMSDLEWFLYQNKYAFSKQSDLTPWDTGFYLQAESHQDQKVEGDEDPFAQFPSFEQLNREADYAWTTANKRTAGHRPEGSRSFGKFLREFFSQEQVKKDRKEQKGEQPRNIQSHATTLSPSSLFNEKELAKNQKQVEDEKTGINIHQYYKNVENGSNWRAVSKQEDPELDLFTSQEKNKAMDDSALNLKLRAEDDLELESYLFYTQKLSLSPFFNLDLIPPEPIQQILEKRFYETTAYKKALDFDIDLFASRQPKNYLLSQQEEIELLEKRQSLSKYYETLRAYDDMLNFEVFNQNFGGSKSYATKFYNQQFKGTLKIVRKLFSIHLSDGEASTPSLSGGLRTPSLAFHQSGRGGLRTPLAFDQPLFLEKGKKVPIFHEEILKQRGQDKSFQKESLEKKSSPIFLKAAGSRPLYAGWDEHSKKLILTNRYLSRSSAGKELLISDDQKSQYPTLKSLPSLNFTSWPMPRTMFSQHKNTNQISINYNLMYQINPLEDNPLEERWKMKTTPRNYGPSSVDPTETFTDPTQYIWKIFAPDRGGILWPGSKKVEFIFTSNSDSVPHKTKQ
jgi:hypothetical protein